MPRAPKPIRYTVLHYHQAGPGFPVERATVSYNAGLPEALSYAINTALRYAGNILAEFDDGTVSIIRRYLHLAEKTAPVTGTIDPDTAALIPNQSTR